MHEEKAVSRVDADRIEGGVMKYFLMSIVLLVVTLLLYGVYYRLTDVRQMMGT